MLMPPPRSRPYGVAPWARRRFMTSCVASQSTPRSQPPGLTPQRVDHPGKHHLADVPVAVAVFRAPGSGTDLAAHRHHLVRAYPVDQPASEGQWGTAGPPGGLGSGAGHLSGGVTPGYWPQSHSESAAVVKPPMFRQPVTDEAQEPFITGGFRSLLADSNQRRNAVTGCSGIVVVFSGW
jgi:hypothetical protein